MRPTWPLTGRAEELAFIAASLASGGGARGAVLAGSAGVGKTRLAREALARAEQRGMATRWVAATESARGVPLGAFAAMFRSVVVEDPIRALRGVTEELRAGDRGGGVIIGVDDAHLLDPWSAMLVHQLVLRDLAAVVVTVRTGASAPDAVTAVWKDLGLDRLEVQPLSEDKTGTLLETVLTAPIDIPSTRRMWALTRGNVLFLRELVDGEVRAGRLHADRGVWRWSGDPMISSELVEVVEARMGCLSGSVREVVDLLAIGEPLGADVLAALTDPVAVEDAEAQGLVSVERDGRRVKVMLAHPLYGETRLARVGPLRARRLRGDIVRALGRPGPWYAADTLRRAALAVQSDLVPDPELFLAGARLASNLADMSLAERLARAAVDAGGGFQSQLALATALTFQNHGGDAEAVLAELAGRVSSDFERSVVAVARAGNLLWGLRSPVPASVALARAEQSVQDTKCRVVLAAMRAALDVVDGRLDTAVDTAAEILADRNAPTEAVLLGSLSLVTGLALLGRGDELSAGAEHGYAIVGPSVEVSYLRFGLTFAHLHGLRLAGHLHEMEAVALTQGLACSEMLGRAPLYGIAFAGEAALARGRIDQAVRCFREILAALEPIDTQDLVLVSLLRLTEALAIAGDLSAAGRTCDRLESDRHPAYVFLGPDILLARAWVTAAEGHLRRAITVTHAAAAEAVRLGQPASEVMALQTAVRFGDRTVADRLATLAGTVDGPRAPAAAAHAFALAGNDGEALSRVSTQLEEMGDVLAAADASAQAATVHTERGRTGTANIAAARAQRLVQACGGAHTPAVDAAARPLPLTEREREIITLAARGLSNRAIAEQLVVSIRTVEGHLYNASARLGITNRSELASILFDS